MTEIDAERTPWFRCGIDDPERPGLYEIGVPRADGRCPELCMGRWLGDAIAGLG